MTRSRTASWNGADIHRAGAAKTRTNFCGSRGWPPGHERHVDGRLGGGSAGRRRSHALADYSRARATRADRRCPLGPHAGQRRRRRRGGSRSDRDVAPCGTWWLVPDLLVWGYALVAAVSCDAVTQRIPTPLVRQAAVGAGVLLTLGLAVHGDWRGLLLSGVAAAAAGAVLLLCWRFAGAGFGDVRLAVLGGLGLGHATHRGLFLALAALSLITVTQAVIKVMRGGGRQSTFPYGPALAVGLLLAATLRL
jgi:hypothetical protein